MKSYFVPPSFNPPSALDSGSEPSQNGDPWLPEEHAELLSGHILIRHRNDIDFFVISLKNGTDISFESISVEANIQLTNLIFWDILSIYRTLYLPLKPKYPFEAPQI